MDFSRAPARFLRSTALAACALGAVAGPSCAPTDGTTYNLHSDPNDMDPTHAKVVRLTLLHTSDIHSRLFPYDYTPLLPDTQAGLQAGMGPYGGVARVAYILNRERGLSDRVMHLNGGDMFEGAPVFNYFNGEAEMRALAQLQTDAMVIANHEFDKGPFVVFNAIQKWADFPVLAANYAMTDPSVPGASPLGAVLKPYTIVDVRGLRVAVIGMGNLSTVTSIFDKPNKLGIMPWDTTDIAQYYIDLLRPQADLIVLLTHLGLEEDQRMIENIEGADIVLGGHNHIVISPPQELFDCGGVNQDVGYVNIGGAISGDPPSQRACHPRRVLLMHSGAFAKFVGRLDLDVTDSRAAINNAYGYPPDSDHYDAANGFEVISHSNKVIPIDNTVPDDVPMDTLLEPYKEALVNVGNLDLLVGYAPNIVKRTAPSSGDSALGNLIAISMWQRLGVQTDLAMTNTTGIRADLPQGPVTVEQLFNVFPFDNTITKMQLSGHEVVAMFDYAAQRSQSRSCVSQIQIAGSAVSMDCNGCDPDYRPDVGAGASACAEQIFVGYSGTACTQDSDCEVDFDPAVVASDPTHKLSRFICDHGPSLCRFSVLRYSVAPDGSRSLAAPGTYAFATSNYLAGGGSGFITLKQNTTQLNTQINQRDAVTDFVQYGKPCGWQVSADGSQQGLWTCSTDADCSAPGGPGAAFVCACADTAAVDAKHTTAAAVACNDTGGACAAADDGSPGGRCVLTTCRDDVANFHNSADCNGVVGDDLASCQLRACSEAGEQCKILTCVDDGIGALVDGRIQMLGR